MGAHRHPHRPRRLRPPRRRRRTRSRELGARPAPAATGLPPLARSHGHPGGWRRERYLNLIREFAGRGVTLDDPYDPALVRSAPRDIRHTLADALAEEATARSLASLGIAFTVWHDLATDAAGPGLPPKLDHLVLGPTGLFAIQSEDWGGPVRIRRGELIGEALAGERPVRALAARAKAVGRAAKVKPTALLVVVPDDAAEEPLAEIGRVRGAAVALVRRSRLASAVREGIPGSASIGGTELMEVRTRLQQAVRFA
ncbi:nuclease-related domain-containing protein [Agromyces archimandritae]|uniref:nuclease-related domain-containing protein n=1 Tax=Agromyces archimandritae TaxID=2781962 RepID=UPI0031406885